MTQKQYYLAETYLQPSLFTQLLTENNTNALIHVQVLSPEVFLSLNCPSQVDNANSFLEVAHRLLASKSELKVYQDMVQYPAFIRQIVDFRNIMEKYELTLCNLPTDNESEQELKEILSWIMNIPFSIQNQKKSIRQWSHLDLNHVHWVNPENQSLDCKKVINQFIEKGMHVIPLKSSQPLSKHFYKALNKRQEIEAVAQWILHHEMKVEDIQIILCDASGYQSLIQTVFSRYQIPFAFTHLSQNSIITQVFISLLRLFNKPSVEKMLVCYQNKCFTSTIDYNYFKFTQTYFVNWDDLLNFQPIDAAALDLICNEYQRSLFTKQQRTMQESHFGILPLLKQIDQLVQAPFLTQIEFIFTLLKKHVCLADANEMKCLSQIKTLLQSCHPSLQSIADIPFLIDLLTPIQNIKIETIENKIAITDLDRPLDARKITFVLGCNQKNFPNFVKNTGVFDEDYLQKTNYPAYALRYQHHLSRLDSIFHSGEDLYFSYAMGGYDGKSSEAAFEIESFVATTAKLWPLLEDNYYYKPTHQLSPECSSSLFFKNNLLHGSVSSFERYFACPYAYFIEKGLKLKKDFVLEINSATIGTIQHALLEQCIQLYHDQYAKVSHLELSNLAKPYFQQGTLLYPFRKAELEIIEQRMIDNLYSLFVFLQDMQINTSFKPIKCEYHFNYTIQTENHVEVALNGIIDRIDMNLDYLRIIDYKSSAKTLSEKKVVSGLQLQLLTYLVVACDLMNARPMGAYYCSLKDEVLKVEAAKLDLIKNECFEFDESRWNEQKQAAQRLSGWTFDNPEFLDYSANHISGLKLKDDKSVLIKEPYDFDKVEAVITDLMNQLTQRLSEGDIRLDPYTDACTFCDYQPICHFHGIQKKLSPDLESISLKKEVEE